MTRIDVFDPPMCCSTGVCGPSVDPRLTAFAADLEWLSAQGVTVTRHNLVQDPQAFLAEASVTSELQRSGDSCLPLILVDGKLVEKGVYPRRDELARLAGITAAASSTKRRIRLSASGGCTPGSGCC